TVLRVAAEQPDRVTHVVVVGGFAETLVTDEAQAALVRAERGRMLADWPAYVEEFIASIFTEPHSTKPFEDGVRYGWATSAEVIDLARKGWGGKDVRDLAR